MKPFAAWTSLISTGKELIVDNSAHIRRTVPDHSIIRFAILFCRASDASSTFSLTSMPTCGDSYPVRPTINGDNPPLEILKVDSACRHGSTESSVTQQ